MENTILTQVTKAMEIDTKSIYESITDNKGNVTEITHKEYQLLNPIGKRTTLSIYDINTIESIEKIFGAIRGKNVLSFVMCKELEKLATPKTLEKLNFKTIAELGKAIFSLETSTVNHYVRIAKNFVNDDYSLVKGLPQLSVSHLVELNAYAEENGVNSIIGLYAEGVLTDGMSTKKLRDAIRHLNGNALEDKNADVDADSDVDNDNVVAVQSASQLADIENQAYDKQIYIARIIAKCTEIDELLATMRENGEDTKDLESKVKALKKVAQKDIVG